MRAAVVDRPRSISLHDRPEPEPLRPGQTLLRPEMVGICGSDLHMYNADLGPSHELFPRVFGHEFSATVEQIDPAGSEFSPGDRVAVWPVMGCGKCRPCRAGRVNVCQHLELIGVHRDGALQDLLIVDTANIVATPDLTPAQAALVEPVSIAVHSVKRGRVQSGEKVVIFGGGPIGFSTALAARDAGAEVLVLDPVAGRRDLLSTAGFRAEWPEPDALQGLVTDMTGPEGPNVVFDTTGRPSVLNTAMEIAGQGDRVVVVGLTSESAPINPGPMPFKELDVLGVCCCVKNEFAAAADLVRRNAAIIDSLVSTVVPLERVRDAFELVEHNPEDAFKVLIDLRVP